MGPAPFLPSPLAPPFASSCVCLQANTAGGDDGDDWAFTPTSKLPDAERFRGVEPLKMTCRTCRQQADFQGVFAWDRKKPVNGPADLRVRKIMDTRGGGGGGGSGGLAGGSRGERGWRLGWVWWRQEGAGRIGSTSVMLLR